MIGWIAHLVRPFQEAAEKAATSVVTAIVDGRVAMERAEATLQRLDRDAAAIGARLKRIETSAEQLDALLERVGRAGRDVQVLVADLEHTSKGIEGRVSRVLKEITADLMKVAASRDAENQRLNDEAERWRKLAIAKYEADMESLPARVAVTKTRRAR